MGHGRTLAVLAVLVPLFGSGCFDSCTNPANWRDEGDKVQRIIFSTQPDQMDEDEPLEMVVWLYGDEGSDESWRSHPFDADGQATVYRHVNDTGTTPWPNWTAIATWNVTVLVEEFTVSKPSNGPCQYRHTRLYVDDTVGVDGESYRLHFVLVLRADGRQVEYGQMYTNQQTWGHDL